jgi:hypothetical protein
MPDIVHLDLTPEGGNELPGQPETTSRPSSTKWKLERQDFRIHGGGVAHWVLRHPLGIDLLVTTMATQRPDMKVPRYRIAPEMLPLLDFMIDVLGMRSWPEPQTMLERVRAGFMLVRYAYCLGSGSALPDWRGMYDGLAA